MANKASLTNGCVTILGSSPIQFAMFLAFVSTVRTPKDELSHLYYWVLTMHIALTLTILLNLHFGKALGIMKSTLNTLMMLFQIVVLVYLCMELMDEEEEVLGEAAADSSAGDKGDVDGVPA